jgi:hypothetical protein
MTKGKAWAGAGARSAMLVCNRSVRGSTPTEVGAHIAGSNADLDPAFRRGRALNESISLENPVPW